MRQGATRGVLVPKHSIAGAISSPSCPVTHYFCRSSQPTRAYATVGSMSGLGPRGRLSENT